MKKFLASIAVICTILISACTSVISDRPTASIQPAQLQNTMVHFVCKNEQIVTDIAGVGMRNKEGLQKANKMLVERFESGDCAPLPGGAMAPVKRLIDLGPDFEGDHMAIVQLDGPEDDVDPYWSIIVSPGKAS